MNENNNGIDRIIHQALNQPPPQPMQIPLITLAEGLAMLVNVGVYTPEQVFNWINHNKEPKEFQGSKP